MRMLLTLLSVFCIFTANRMIFAQENDQRLEEFGDEEFEQTDEGEFEDEGAGFGNLDDLDAVEDALDQVGTDAPEPAPEMEEPEFEEANNVDEGEFENDFGDEGEGNDEELGDEESEQTDEGEFEDDFGDEGTDEEFEEEEFGDEGTVGGVIDITDVQFDGNENGGTIIITTNGEAEFNTRRTNSGKQIVVEIGNVRLPNRFKRPYDTKEFTSNIGFFQGYQTSGSTVSRFVIQLREDIAPHVTQSGNRILIAAQGGVNAEEEMSAEEQADEFSNEPEEFDDSALKADSREDAVKQFYGHLISIELRDSPLIDAIRLIIEESGANILMSNVPSQNITLKLRNVPWDQALSILMESNGLGYTRQGEVMIIRPLADMQKDVQDQANFKKQQVDAKKQQALAEKELENLGPIEEDVIPIFNSEAQKVLAVVNGLKVLTDQGSIQVLEDNNSLLVKDSVNKISEVRALIKEKIDKPALQVLIEGKIIEATEDFDRAFGLNMSTPTLVPVLPAAPDDGQPAGADTAAAGGAFSSSISALSSPYGGPDGAGLTLRLANIPAIALGNLTARLQLTEIKGMTKTLASPRVVTLNNKSATISQTQTVRTSKTSTNTETNTQQTDFDYRDLPLSLNVTPIISADGVTMKVSMQRKFSPGGDTGTEYARDINTEVFVKHGDTTVIGGVYTSDISESESGIPFFMNLPLIGNLFKRNARATNKNELMIFLTPTIINRDVSVGLSLNSVGSEDLENSEEFSEEFGEEDFSDEF